MRHISQMWDEEVTGKSIIERFRLRIATHISWQSSTVSICGSTSTSDPFIHSTPLIVWSSDGGSSKGLIRENAPSGSSIWHVVSQLIFKLSDLSYIRKASPARSCLHCKSEQTPRHTKAERQLKPSSTGKHQHI
jgi:hypothetical protein